MNPIEPYDDPDAGYLVVRAAYGSPPSPSQTRAAPLPAGRRRDSVGVRALRVAVAVFGVVPVVTGLMAVTGGPAGMLDGQSTTPTVDNEVRFLGVYWLAFGVFVLWLVPRVDRLSGAFHAMLAVTFASGCARLLSVLLHGRPHPVIAAAMVVELVLPPVLAWWRYQLLNRPRSDRAKIVL